MEPDPPKAPPMAQTDARLKIYFLPNLMTAGNLVCGFVALTEIVAVSDEDLADGNFFQIKRALFYILLACIFYLLDGRLARIGGPSSPVRPDIDYRADPHSLSA